MTKSKKSLTPADIEDLKAVFATKDDLVKFKDDILHEVVAMREELTMVQGHKDQLEEHEERLVVIETQLQITPAI